MIFKKYENSITPKCTTNTDCINTGEERDISTLFEFLKGNIVNCLITAYNPHFLISAKKTFPEGVTICMVQ